MRTKSEEDLLRILGQAMEGAISHYEYSILARQEESICLNQSDRKWIISVFEHGTDRPIASYNDLKDACISFMEVALPGEKWKKNKEWFFEKTKDI